MTNPPATRANMVGQHRSGARNPNLDLSPEEKLKKLLEVGMEQLKIVYPKNKITQTIIDEMKQSTFKGETRAEAGPAQATIVDVGFHTKRRGAGGSQSKKYNDQQFEGDYAKFLQESR